MVLCRHATRRTLFPLLAVIASIAVATPTFALEPTVTFTFDDAYFDPVYTGALHELEKASFPATLYMPTNRLCNNASWDEFLCPDELDRLFIRGNGIEAHTKSHPNLTTLSDAQLMDEIQGSKQVLEALGYPQLTFAYPMGASDARVRQAVQNAGFVAARGTDTALNFSTTDPYNLRAHSLKAGVTVDQVRTWVDRAHAEGGWYIILIHKIDRAGDSMSISLDFFKQVVAYVKQKGIRVVTVAEGACIHYNRGC